MSTTLGGTTLPQPMTDGIAVEIVPIGSERRMLSGYLSVDMRAYKRKITIRWDGLTSSERTTLFNAWLANLTAEAVLALPDGTSYSVMASAQAWAEQHWYDYNANVRYTISIGFSEV